MANLFWEGESEASGFIRSHAGKNALWRPRGGAPFHRTCYHNRMSHRSPVRVNDSTAVGPMRRAAYQRETPCCGKDSQSVQSQ